MSVDRLDKSNEMKGQLTGRNLWQVVRKKLLTIHYKKAIVIISQIVKDSALHPKGLIDIRHAIYSQCLLHEFGAENLQDYFCKL